MPRRAHTSPVHLAGLLFLVVFIQPLCLGQRYSFRTYAQAEGLADLNPQCMLQDHTGFIWVGTQNGLFRYDGIHFDAFNVSEGLPGAQIVALYETPDGSLIVGTSSGLARLAGNRFEAIRAGDKPLVTIRRSGITADSAGRLYVATQNGLTVLSTADDGDINPSLLSTIAPAVISSLYTDPRGDVWAGCGDRLCRVIDGRLVQQAPELPAEKWFGIRANAAGGMWLLSAHSVWERAAGQTRFHELPPLPVNHHGYDFAPFLGDPVLELDRTGAVIATSASGVSRWSRNHWRLIDARAGLARNDITAMLSDREGSLWVGIAGLGLARCRGCGQWESWGATEGIAHESIWAVHRDSAGTLWVGSSGGLSYARKNASGALQ